ncbi:MAG: hypothetical protein A2Y17_07320 [Clostridiales bacterium GWF2_38_85]|nr:MAG: hypothetical protein A2Y17_07320 [Clostridiales bacterium GWF2_38_85]
MAAIFQARDLMFLFTFYSAVFGNDWRVRKKILDVLISVQLYLLKNIGQISIWNKPVFLRGFYDVVNHGRGFRTRGCVTEQPVFAPDDKGFY